MGLAPSGSVLPSPSFWSQFPSATIQPVTPPNGNPTAPVAFGSGATLAGGSLAAPGSALVNPAGMATTNLTTAAPTAPTAPGSNTGDVNAAIQAYVSAHPTPDINALAAALKAQGFNVSIPTHAGGTLPSTDKLVLPDSSVVDLISSGGQWQSPINDGYWVNGQPSTTPASQGLTPPSASAGGGGTLAGLSGGVGGFQAPAPFVPPGPGLTAGQQFSIQQGNQGIQRSAAAKGSLLTGGTLKDLSAYDIGQSEQDEQQNFNNALSAYQTNASTPLQYDQLNSNNLLGLSNIGLSATGEAVNAGNNFATNQTNLITGGANAGAAGTIASGTNWANWFATLDPATQAQIRQSLSASGQTPPQ